MRVITQALEISTDKDELKKDANYEILGLNAIQQASKQAKAGDVRGAQAKAKVWNKIMTKNAQTEEATEHLNMFKGNMNQMYSQMNQQYQQSFQPQVQQQSDKYS